MSTTIAENRKFDIFGRDPRNPNSNWDGVSIEKIEEDDAFGRPVGYRLADDQYSDDYATLSEALREYAAWIENTLDYVLEYRIDSERGDLKAEVTEHAETEISQALADAEAAA